MLQEDLRHHLFVNTIGFDCQLLLSFVFLQSMITILRIMRKFSLGVERIGTSIGFDLRFFVVRRWKSSPVLGRFRFLSSV